ncbi:MAG: translation initiation factor IF-3 [Planctomycetota bacterium]
MSKNLRRNERIRISPIRLIGADDEQFGVMDTVEAMAKAKEAGLDLVEVAPTAEPPVCRIMDYGKWLYSQKKKDQKSKAHRHETELKEIRIRTPKIGDHDLEIKVQHAKGFLSRGDRVQFTLRFRGRELAHIDEGERIFEEITKQLVGIAKIDQPYRREGRRITMTLGPAPKAVVAPVAKKPAAGGAQPSAPPVPPASPAS